MAKTNLSNLAKKTNTGKTTPVLKNEKVVNVVDESVAEIKPVVKVVEKPKTNDEKAKEIVGNLLSDIKLPEIGQIEDKQTISNSLDVDATTSTDEYVGTQDKTEIQWLEEQIIELNNEIDRLKNNVGNENNNTNVSDSDVSKNTVLLFNELQDQYDYYVRTGGKLHIDPKGFMKRLIDFFPYLQNYRRRLIDEQ